MMTLNVNTAAASAKSPTPIPSATPSAECPLIREGLEKCDKALTACDKALEDSEKKSQAMELLLNNRDTEIVKLKNERDTWYRQPAVLIGAGIILGLVVPKVIGN